MHHTPKTPLPVRAERETSAQSASRVIARGPLASPLQGVPFQSPVANVSTVRCPLRPSRTP